jgi:hypothetical protein
MVKGRLTARVFAIISEKSVLSGRAAAKTASRRSWVRRREREWTALESSAVVGACLFGVVAVESAADLAGQLLKCVRLG